MATPVSLEVPAFERDQPITRHASLSTTTIEQESNEFREKQRVKPDVFVDTRSWHFREHPFELIDGYQKIEPEELPFDQPWLPPSVLRLLDKLKRRSITEQQFVNLIGKVAERASDHFQLEKGKFVALTFYGRVVEVSDTRVGLLKKLHIQPFQERVFVWRVGFTAFSGRRHEF